MLDTVEHHEIDHAAAAGTAVQHVLHRDYENRSCTVLRIAGTFKYATDPTTESCAARTRR